VNADTTKGLALFFWAEPSSPSTGFSQVVGRAFRALSERSRRRRAFAELNALTDRELADIGITRGDIGQALGGR
jgi:uncharacterized protein YjiS (DUF1127 family)